MSNSILAKPATQTVLKRALAVISIAGSIALIWLVSMLLIYRSEIVRSKTASAEHLRSINDTRAVIARASKGDQSSVPKGLAAVSAFQTAVESSARQRNCVMDEFRTGSDMAPFLSKFTKETSISGWTQVGIQFTLHGKLVDVIETVRSFTTQRVPFELDTLDLSREKVKADGSAVISARVVLRVLIPQTEVA